MDISKLRLPWKCDKDNATVMDAEDCRVAICWINPRVMLPENMQAYRDCAEAITKVFQAVEILMRRRWAVAPRGNGWVVLFPEGSAGHEFFKAVDVEDGKPDFTRADPISAVLDVEDWYTTTFEGANHA